MIMFLLAACLLRGYCYVNDQLAPFKSRKNLAMEREACEIARGAVNLYVKERKLFKPSGYSGVFSRPIGVFVTIVKNGKVRGCMGTIKPVEINAAREIVRSAMLAASCDPWHPNIQKHELPHLKYIISIVGDLRRVDSASLLNPKRLGLLVQKQKRSALLLPGEAETIDWQIYECKRKAGIGQNEKVEMFVFETVTLGPY